MDGKTGPVKGTIYFSPGSTLPHRIILSGSRVAPTGLAYARAEGGRRRTFGRVAGKHCVVPDRLL